MPMPSSSSLWMWPLQSGSTGLKVYTTQRVSSSVARLCQHLHGLKLSSYSQSGRLQASHNSSPKAFIPVSFLEMPSFYLEILKPNTRHIIWLQWPENEWWKLLINWPRKMPHEVTPQIEARPPSECSGQSTTTPPCQSFGASWILHLLRLAFLAHHPAESEGEKTVCDGWSTTEACSCSLGGCRSHYQPSNSLEHSIFVIMMACSLATCTGFLPGQPLHQMSPFFYCYEPLWALLPLPGLYWKIITNCIASSRKVAFRHFGQGPSIRNAFYIVASICVQVRKYV